MPMLRLCIPECCLIPIVNEFFDLCTKQVLISFVSELQSLEEEGFAALLFFHQSKVHVF